MHRGAKLISLSWFRLARERQAGSRRELLTRRLREFFEDRNRTAGEPFRPSREEVVFIFQLRGYAMEEIGEALADLTADGVLNDAQGWYRLQNLDSRPL